MFNNAADLNRSGLEVFLYTSQIFLRLLRPSAINYFFNQNTIKPVTGGNKEIKFNNNFERTVIKLL